MERIKSDGLVRIVPVSIRHDDCKDSVFRDFSVIPENNKPISSWPNIDEAWLHVVNEIKKAAEKARMLKHNNLPEDGKHEYKLTDNFMKALSDTEVVFYTGKKENIRLEDIYIFPGLKLIKKEYDKVEVYIDSEELRNVNFLGKQTLILGDEQSGKTSLAKTIF